MRSSIRKPKKVNISTFHETSIANSTLELHQDQELHKMIPSLKKYQSSEI